jgi:hypothetical protein
VWPEYCDIFETSAVSEARISQKRYSFFSNLAKSCNNSKIRRSSPEALSAAGGVVAKQINGSSPPDIHDRAGFASKVDLLFGFGHESYDEKNNAVAAEVKCVRQSLQKAEGILHRWFTNGAGALYPQLLQSMIGHGTPVALAVTEWGFKAFFWRLSQTQS